MYCTRCGSILPLEARYCAMCGQPQGAPVVEYASPVLPKRLTRPRRRKKIAGVCAGFALYMGLDVTTVRVVWLIATLLTGVPLIVYLVGWAVMPLADAGAETA